MNLGSLVFLMCLMFSVCCFRGSCNMCVCLLVFMWFVLILVVLLVCCLWLLCDKCFFYLKDYYVM